jgi:hypothetical protein
MPRHDLKKLTFLSRAAAKKNPGVQEGKMGVHVNAGDAIADPCRYVAENNGLKQAFCDSVCRLPWTPS